MNIFDLPVHPAADVFPMLDQDELTALAVDIKNNGLQHPIVIGEIDGVDTLIDGRNRLAACKLASVEPETKRINGIEPEALILSENIHRRHMSKGQQAMAVAMMFPEASKGGRGKRVTKNVMVSTEYMKQARAVLRDASDLVGAVMTNDKETGKPLETLSSAYAVAVENKKAAEDVENQIAREQQERETAIRTLSAHPDDADILEQFHDGKLKADIAVGMVKTREHARRVDRQGWWDILTQLDTLSMALNDAQIQLLTKDYKAYGKETEVDLKKLAQLYAQQMTNILETL